MKDHTWHPFYGRCGTCIHFIRAKDTCDSCNWLELAEQGQSGPLPSKYEPDAVTLAPMERGDKEVMETMAKPLCQMCGKKHEYEEPCLVKMQQSIDSMYQTIYEFRQRIESLEQTRDYEEEVRRRGE